MQVNLKEFLKSIDYYKLLQPTNYVDEKVKFFAALTRGEGYNPQFIYEYPRSSSFRVQKKLLSSLKAEVPAEFLELYSQVIEMTEAWAAHDYNVVTEISGALFGDARGLDADVLAQTVVAAKAQIPHAQKVDSSQVAAALVSALSRFNLPAWEVILSQDNPSEISIYPAQGQVIVRDKWLFDEADIERIICHELQAHAFQYLNSLQNQPQAVFTSYLGTETQYEGLALLTEINSLGRSAIASLVYRYCLFMLASKLSSTRAFYDTYLAVLRITDDAEFAFLASARAKRGFADTSVVGSFQKENSYITGAYQILEMSEGTNMLGLLDTIARATFPLQAIGTPLISQLKPALYVPNPKINQDDLDTFCGILSRIFQ